MKIACLSGKGGAGKTFVAVNLAVTASKFLPDTDEKGSSSPVTYIDCDVEEPNGRLFLKPSQVEEVTVGKLLPEFDSSRCTGCRACVDFCRFHALMYIKEKPMVFPEVCHSCGGCSMVCPEGAVEEKAKPIGTLEIGDEKNLRIVTGILNPGEASGVPVIQEALARGTEMTIIDCPPGSACSVMESVMDADYCILVVEPTAFGFHNFKMVYELVTLLHRNCGVVINKETEAYEPLEQFCKEHKIPILARIAYDPKIAAMTAAGQVLTLEDGSLVEVFDHIYETVRSLVLPDHFIDQSDGLIGQPGGAL